MAVIIFSKSCSQFAVFLVLQKNWKKIWMMLFPPCSSGIGRVELYVVRDGQVKPGIWKAGRRVIRLADCVSICPAPEESCPPDHVAFYLNTTQRTYALAAESHEDWIPRLCQLAFQVWCAALLHREL